MLTLLPRTQAPARLEERYGLAYRPFGPALDQRFVYPSPSYATALREVQRALEQREGLVVITGDTGSGKTMLCRTLLQQLETPVCVSIVLDPHVTVDDLLLHLLADLGVAIAPRQGSEGTTVSPTRQQLMRALQRCLASLVPVGAYAVLVIDEAHHLDPSVLEQLRLLLNLETDQTKLLQIVLFGHHDLNRLLTRPDMQQLDQRVARRCELTPLTRREVQGYVGHRLATAQAVAPFTDIDACASAALVVGESACGVSFTRSAIRAVTAQSRGIPRAVNLLCDRALEIGNERGTYTINARIVREAAARVAVRAPARSGIRRAGAAALAAAALAFVVAGLGEWTWGGRRAAPALPLPPAVFAAISVPIPAVLPGTPTDVGAIHVIESVNVRAASFRAESEAVALAAALEAGGLPAFTRRQGVAWDVIVGPYISEAQTVAVRDLLEAFGHAGTEVLVDRATPAGGLRP